MQRLKRLITRLLEDNHPNDLAELTGADEGTCLRLVHEIRKEGGLHDPSYWEPEKSGDIWAIYGKTFSAEYIDANGDCLAFDTKREALDFIRKELR